MATKTSKLLCWVCDTVVVLPAFRKNIACYCPCCKNRLRSGYRADLYDVAVVSIASVLLFLTALNLPFMTISSMGLSQSMSLTSIFFVLQDEWSLLLGLFLLFTFFCPMAMHCIVIGIVFFKLNVTKFIAQLYAFCHRFSMVDVFVLGVLISLIKLVALAKVEFHSGFYCTLVFALLMVWCFSRGKPFIIWNLVDDPQKEEAFKEAHPSARGIEQNLILCRHCGRVYKAALGFKPFEQVQECPRCGHHNGIRAPHCYQKSLAFLIAAVIMYVPSNVYPIMFTTYLGANLGSNIIDGVISLWQMHSYFVAIVILVASICIPIIKIICILLLMYWSYKGFNFNAQHLNTLYRIVIFIGRWSMIDVFVVIIMSTVVQMSGLLAISPGLAIICFSFVVLLTMLAAEELDVRLLWDRKLEQAQQANANLVKNYQRLSKLAPNSPSFKASFATSTGAKKSGESQSDDESDMSASAAMSIAQTETEPFAKAFEQMASSANVASEAAADLATSVTPPTLMPASAASVEDLESKAGADMAVCARPPGLAASTDSASKTSSHSQP